MVDSGGIIGKDTSIALDSHGHPHISYRDQTNNSIKYAYFDGSAWHKSFVNGSSNGLYSQIAIDSNDVPHIAFSDNTNQEVKYASFNGSGWNVVIVDCVSVGLLGLSLSIDKNDIPHIAYIFSISSYFYYLRHAKLNGTIWDITTIETGSNITMYYPSIATDNYNCIHISYGYQNPDIGQLKYAFYNNSIWTTDVVDSGIISSYYNSSIAVDDNCNPHISYYALSEHCIKHAYRDNAHNEWIKSVVETQPNDGRKSSIAVDSLGKPHIAYLFEDTYIFERLKYASTVDRKAVVDKTPSPRSNLTINKLYPQPASNSLTCSIYLKDTSDVQLTICDLSGRMVYQQNIGNINGIKDVLIDTRTLMTGVYSLQCHSANGTESKYMVIKR